MKIRLGYVAISLTLDEIDHYQTITWTRLQNLEKSEQEEKLSKIIHHNLDFLEKILKYNIQNEVFFYRLSHNMIPLATYPGYSYDFITPYKQKWKKIGTVIKKNHLRVDIHPNQFCVLNSTNPVVVEQTIEELKVCNQIYKSLGIPGKVILHVGSSIPNKEEAMKRFKTAFDLLDEEIKSMILLENDDKVYTAKDVLKLCEELKIPMVLDYHHYLCNHGTEKIEKLLPQIFETWKGEKLPPKVHFSSPKSRKERRSHSTYISYQGFLKFLKVISPYGNEVDVMLECKGKDEALFRLVRQLKMDSQYQFLNNSTLIIKEDSN